MLNKKSGQQKAMNLKPNLSNKRKFDKISKSTTQNGHKENKTTNFVGIKPAGKANKHIVFDDDNDEAEEKLVAKTQRNKPGNKSEPKVNTKAVGQQNKRIVFDSDNEDGDDNSDLDDMSSDDENTEKQSKKTSKSIKMNSREKAKEIGQRWYEEYENYNSNGEVVEMKDSEIQELTNICRISYETNLPLFQKRNPSDAKWLKTALQKGTSRDRANAGALLVQTNPLGNLDSLEVLIGLTKNANKTSTDAVDIITELFMNALLPQYRKLIPLTLRGADWKLLRKNEEIEKSTKDKIFAYWHFEANLKEQYFEFLRNLQAAIQGSQDTSKNQAIIYASKLLSYAPEKEQMLLSMLVNKLGDPSNKVAAKALHHLTEVSYKHPAMCGVITNETEKFLFRNNITEHAQHFALCFLSQLAPNGNIDVCKKLVNICFSFFKILVNKGAINSKTMQAILRCLKKAIGDVVLENKTAPGSDFGFMSKDMQDTVYRLIHFADIQISLQTLALLLQVITVADAGNHDRFYNALYKKLLDPDLASCGTKVSAFFLHIVHRAIHIDTNRSRAQAFIKRLLQVALHFPPQMVCGCLIVVNKLIKARIDLNKFSKPEVTECYTDSNAASAIGDDDDDDGDEHYTDAVDETENDKEEKEKNSQQETEDVKPSVTSSWHHITNTNSLDKKEKASEVAPSNYNPYHRVPAFAGAEFVLRTELVAFQKHYHPTVRVFAQNLIDNTSIKFYGDPLRDFSLTQFLERFSFKNPKKLDDTKTSSDSIVKAIYNKPYTPSGGRGLSVNQLTSTNCTEDERFIFEFLQRKRERHAALGLATKDDDEFVDKYAVDDDEFDAYLDSMTGTGASKKKRKRSGDDVDADEEDLDFLGELGDDLKSTERKKGKKSDADDDAEADDWNSDDEDDDGIGAAGDAAGEFDDDSDDDGSISLDDNENSDSDIFEDDDDDAEDNEVYDPSDDEDEPKAKKAKGVSGKDFQKKLKHTSNMQSLFAAAEDFSEMLDDTGKSDKHGTLNELFNKDKSSEKQLQWEQKRMKGPNFRRKPKPSPKRKRSQGKNKRGEIKKTPQVNVMRKKK